MRRWEEYLLYFGGLAAGLFILGNLDALIGWLAKITPLLWPEAWLVLFLVALVAVVAGGLEPREGDGDE